MERWADLVVGVLDQLGVEKATVVGESMGGYLAIALLRHHTRTGSSSSCWPTPGPGPTT